MLRNHWLKFWCSQTARRGFRSGVDRQRRCYSERLEPRRVLSATAAIQGTVFNDLNESSQLDAGDTGLAGWTVFVDSNDNKLLDLEQLQAESNADIEIPDLGEGISSFEVSDVLGTIAEVFVLVDISHTYPDDLRAFLVSPSGTRVKLFHGVGGHDSTILRYASFVDGAELQISSPEADSQFVGSFRPIEALGTLAGESPNGTWRLEINDEQEFDSGVILLFHITFGLAGPNSEPFSVTDDTGAYRIAGLAPGTYSVQEVRQRGYFQTFPETESQTVMVEAGQTTADVNFGNVAAPGAIFGQVWDDLNGDGLHDLNEPGANDWTIELLDADTLEILETTVSIPMDLNEDGRIDPLTEDGRYKFVFLRPGNYLVREVLRDGWKETAPQADNSVVGDDPVVEAGTFEVTESPRGTVDSPAPWLPDLIVDMENSGGLRHAFLEGDILRFGQASPNVGDGPLRLVGADDNGDGTQQVVQRIFNDQGGFTDRLAGNFSFHPEHNHIHFNGFAVYSLRTVLPDQNNDGIPDVGDVVRGGAKTSFCLVNVQRYFTNPPLPNADPDGSGFGCDVQQEISVGWEDIYGAGTEGQEINVAGLEPGDYWLEATVDPDNHFIEKDETNNTGRILIHLGPALRAHRVTIDPGIEVNGQDFGNFQPITVSGSVFNDTNSNGQRNVREQGLAHIAVFLDTNGDHILNNPTSGDGVADGLAQEPWAITDANGNFQFAGLDGGTYQVRVVAPQGQIQTTETPPSFVAISGHDVVTGSFGLGPRPKATTQVTLSEDGHIVVSDIAVGGQIDRLTVSIEGFLFVVEQQLPFVTPQVRIHDPYHILTTTIGVQEGLHTVFVPITEDIASNLVEINLGDGNDVLKVDFGMSPGAVLVNGGNGNDKITIIGGFDFFPIDLNDLGDHANQIEDHDHTGEDRLGFFGTSTVNGGSGNDRIEGRDTLNDLILNGDDGNDSIIGGSGDDVIQGGRGTDTLSGGDGSDELLGGDGADQLRGDRGTDTLQGDAGNDVMRGGADDDLFRSGAGDGLDTVDGGTGFDTIHVDGAAVNESFSVSVMGSSRATLKRVNGDPLVIEITASESLIVNGLEGNDRLTVGPNAASVIGVSFDGGEGDDTMQFNGSARDDRYLLADYNHSLVNVNIPRSVNVANVSAGTEHVLANLGDGDDQFLAGDVFVESIHLIVHGGAGNDTINGGAGRDRLFGDNGNDALYGAAGDDFLAGGNGADELQGSLGSDTMSGGADDDRLDGGDGDDLLNGNRGNDTLFGSMGNDALIGLEGKDRLEGNEGSDTLLGGVGNDQLFGGEEDDLLFGNDGDDRLDGQAGQDTLVGGNGRNSFIHPTAGEIVAVFRFSLQQLFDQF